MILVLEKLNPYLCRFCYGFFFFITPRRKSGKNFSINFFAREKKVCEKKNKLFFVVKKNN